MWYMKGEVGIKSWSVTGNLKKWSVPSVELETTELQYRNRERKKETIK